MKKTDARYAELLDRVRWYESASVPTSEILTMVAARIMDQYDEDRLDEMYPPVI